MHTCKIHEGVMLRVSVRVNMVAVAERADVAIPGLGVAVPPVSVQSRDCGDRRVGVREGDGSDAGTTEVVDTARPVVEEEKQDALS